MKAQPGKKANISEQMDTVHNNLLSVRDSVLHLVDSTLAGKLDVRVDNSGYRGDWAKIVGGYQNRASFDGQNLSAWLYKITYNQSINKLRRRKFFIFGNIPENTVAPENTGFSDDTLNALSLLKPQDRALSYARIMDGYNYDELSKQMNQSPAALRKRYERAKKKLANHLGTNYGLKGAKKREEI